jgi:hypothetical protein
VSDKDLGFYQENMYLSFPDNEFGIWYDEDNLTLAVKTVKL